MTQDGVTCEGEWRQGELGPFGMLKFNILRGLITEVYTFVKIQGMLYLKFVHFTVHNFYLKKERTQKTTIKL